MYYTIYKTTNKLNGKFYVGKHYTENLNDDYLGSGVLLIKAIKEYGKDSFVKEVLSIFSSEEEMNLEEKMIIIEEFVIRDDTYNLGIGGEGGSHFKGKKHSEETKQRIRKSLTGKTLSKEHKLQISQANSKRIITPEFRDKMSKLKTGKPRSEETKIKISKSQMRRWSRSSSVAS